MTILFGFYDEINGEILNRKRSFFYIKGIQEYENGEIKNEQPIIVQPEIGYLGIICKEFDGVINFLMQAKVEPGNVNGIQISPTIQATKSNFTKEHGGNMPPYFEYFENATKYKIISDQIQSEQSSRFYRKRNRNIIIKVNEDIEVLPNYKWMTLGQIKKLMDIDNLVNMDTRTVLSHITFLDVFNTSDKKTILSIMEDEAWVNSLFSNNRRKEIIEIYNYINDYKMFNNQSRILVPLSHVSTWHVNNEGVFCKNESNFEVKFYDISITGREVQSWSQPLIKAKGEAVLGLIVCNYDGKKKHLVSVVSEIGIFDKLEIGPSIQVESIDINKKQDSIYKLFKEKLNKNEGIIKNVILSEEGGRFFNEQNRNVIIEVKPGEIENLPEGYFWVDYSTLDSLLHINNCINIQLRNLLSIMER